MRKLMLAAVAALFCVGSAPAVYAQATPGGKTAGKAVGKGQQIYDTQKCSMCHSVAGKGNAKGSLDDVGSKLKREEIRQWLLTPQVMTEKSKSTRTPKMPAYTKLSQDDLNALIDYLETLKKK